MMHEVPLELNKEVYFQSKSTSEAKLQNFLFNVRVAKSILAVQKLNPSIGLTKRS